MASKFNAHAVYALIVSIGETHTHTCTTVCFLTSHVIFGGWKVCLNGRISSMSTMKLSVAQLCVSVCDLICCCCYVCVRERERGKRKRKGE